MGVGILPKWVILEVAGTYLSASFFCDQVGDDGTLHWAHQRLHPELVCSNLTVLMVMVVNEYILRERVLPSTREGAGGEGVIDRHHQHPLGCYTLHTELGML